MASDSTLVSKGPCDECGSSDGNTLWSDGHTHCFVCDTHKKGEGEVHSTPTERKRVAGLIPADELEYGPITARKITEETARKFGYATAKLNGKAVHVAIYRDAEGAVVGHKLRTRTKDFPWLGEPKKAALFGQHIARDHGRRIVITEGEIDAMSVAQVLGTWPAVSIPNGAQGAKKDLAKHVDWLSNYDEVVLCFDNDEAGQKAIPDVAALFPPGKVKVVSLPLKDASDMLQADRAGELVECLWNARTWRPDGIKTLGDIRASILETPAMGLPWAFPSVTGATYGRRLGECVALGAGTGIGKTDFITQQVAFDVTDLNEKVGLFFLEQQPAETGKRLAGKVAARRFHIPDAGWSSDELAAALDRLDRQQNLFFYDSFGATEWDAIRSAIRVMAHSDGVRLFYLDHLTALAAAEEDERKALEKIMAELGSLVKELNIWLLFVSHLATPEGKPHEEGGRVMIRHFKGSRSIGFWAHFMLGLERNQQEDDQEARHTTTLRFLKDRYTGRSTGRTIDFGYDDETGLLFEKDAEPADPLTEGDEDF